MASIFWDAHGVIFIDHLKKGRTITGAYYAALLDGLVDEIRKKRATYEEEKNLFSWWKCTISQIEDCTCKKAWIGFRIAPTSTVFSRPGPQRLLSVPKGQEMAVW